MRCKESQISETKMPCGIVKIGYLVVLLVLTVTTLHPANGVVGEETAEEFLKDFNTNITRLRYSAIDAAFVRATNITDYNTKVSANASKVFSSVLKEYRNRAKAINVTNATYDVKRQFQFILRTKTPSNKTINDEIINLSNVLENLYSEGCVPYSSKVKSVNGTGCLKLDKDITPIFSTSRDPEELLYLWKGWRDAVGPELKNRYTEYVRLNNIGARENGFQDGGDYKRKAYEVDNLKESAEKFWVELKPFYEELHAYVRFKLSQQYPNNVDGNGPIPAHLFGNMWAQSWVNINDIVEPYKNESKLDITPTLKEKHNVTSMFKVAEEFFVSLGWQELPSQFWTKSMLKQPLNRSVTCHASAWDFKVVVNGEPDVRVKMCTLVDQNDFITIHHELGHIYYFLKYWNQSDEYRTGANPGFHEAVGDVMALSVQTPNHLYNVGLLPKVSDSEKADINFLMKTALERIAFLPFAYLMDQWMWNVYSGDIKPEEYNKAWWDMRLKYQGIIPPVPRSENDFDPGAKYHIPADTPYIRYFFAHILQFTFHKHGCKAMNFTGELHKCSIYNSKEAGKLLGDMLTLGRSRPWPETLEKMTGSKEITAQPIHEYFAPLTKWLKNTRAEEKYPIGWDDKSTNAGTRAGPSFAFLLSTIAFLIFGL